MSLEHEIKDFVGVYKNLYSSEFCNNVIKFFDNANNHGLTLARQNYHNIDKTLIDDQAVPIDVPCMHDEYNFLGSSNLSAEFLNIFWSSVYETYKNKYTVLGLSDRHSIYTVKIQKTDIGQGYHTWHYETSSRANTNRLLTYILYLNDVEEGGETEFLYFPRRIKPTSGTLVLWPGSFTHTHRGNPPISNSKYVITGWVEF